MSKHEMLVITGLTVVLFGLALTSSVWLARRFIRYSGLVNYAAAVVTIVTAGLLGSMVCYLGYKWLPYLMLGF
jgi:hypothetical protein